MKTEDELLEIMKAGRGEPEAWKLCYQGQMPYFVADSSEIPDDTFAAVTPLYDHPAPNAGQQTTAIVGTTIPLMGNCSTMCSENTTPPTTNQIRAEAFEDAAEMCENHKTDSGIINFFVCAGLLREEAKKLRESACPPK